MATPHMTVRNPARNIFNSEQMIQNAYENAHKRAAYNALQQQYGDIAGNPVAAARLQTIQFNHQNNPNVIRHNVLSNQGLAQVNAFNEANNPALIQNNQATADFNTTRASTAQQQQLSAQHFAVASGALQMLQQQLPKVVDPQMRQAVAANAVRRSAIANGYNPDLAVKQVQPEIQAIGQHGMTALPVIAQRLQQQRLAALGPEGLAKLRQQQATLASTRALTDARRAKIGTNQSAAEASRAAAEASRAEGQVKKSGIIQKLHAQQSASVFLHGKVQNIVGHDMQYTTDKNGRVTVTDFGKGSLAHHILHDIVPKLSPNAVIRVGKSHIPGSPSYDLEQAFETLRSTFSLTDLRSLRKQGLSLGRTNMAEYLGAANSVANLDIGQRLNSQLIPNLKRGLQSMAQLKVGQDQGITERQARIDQAKKLFNLPTNAAEPSAGAAAPTGYFQRSAQVESGGDPNAQSPTSSAQGLFQITAPTYAGIRQAHPEANLPANQATATESQQEVAMKLLTHDNAQTLAGANIPVTPTTLRVAHHFGATGARRILSAPATTPAALVVGANTLAVNNLSPTTTTGDLVQMAQKAMAGVEAPAQPAPQMAAPQQATTQLAQPAPIPQATDEASMNAIYQQLVPQ